MPKIPGGRTDEWMLNLLLRIAHGNQPVTHSNSDRIALYWLKQWGLIRTRIKSNKWEVTSAGYQHLRDEYPDSKHTARVERATNALKKLTKRLQHLGKHAVQCDAEIANLAGAVALLENRVNTIGDAFLAQDRKDAGLV